MYVAIINKIVLACKNYFLYNYFKYYFYLDIFCICFRSVLYIL